MTGRNTLLALGLAIAWATAAPAVVLELEIEKRVIATDLTNLERVQEQLGDATDRMVRLGDDLLRAQKDDEDSGSLTARALDIRRAEAEVAELIATSQQLRISLMSRRSHVDQLVAEVKRLEETASAFADELSGRWQVTVEPGGMRGTFDLKLAGCGLDRDLPGADDAHQHLAFGVRDDLRCRRGQAVRARDPEQEHLRIQQDPRHGRWSDAGPMRTEYSAKSGSGSSKSSWITTRSRPGCRGGGAAIGVSMA